MIEASIDARVVGGVLLIFVLVVAIAGHSCDRNREMEQRRYDICQKAGGYILDSSGQCVIGPVPAKQ